MTAPAALTAAAARRRAERSDYPAWICRPCGEKYGRRECNPVATWHPDICCICGLHADVTEPRDYGHLKPDWKAQEAHEG